MPHGASQTQPPRLPAAASPSQTAVREKARLPTPFLLSLLLLLRVEVLKALPGTDVVGLAWSVRGEMYRCPHRPSAYRSADVEPAGAGVAVVRTTLPPPPRQLQQPGSRHVVVGVGSAASVAVGAPFLVP